VRVFHGGGVEIADEWFCEAVWAGDYAAGDFDLTDIIAGSGGRLRNGKVVFVSSGSTADRLVSLELEDCFWVSNSLSGLLAVLGADIDPTYPAYFSDLGSIVKGLTKYRRVLETSLGPVQLTYFEDLVWEGDALRRRQKPHVNRDFTTFLRYKAFLENSLQSLSENMASSGRKLSYSFLGTLSSGYDSTTITTTARKYGCREVICVDRARGGYEDSGEVLAAHFGVTPHLICRDAWRSMAFSEPQFIAADAKGENIFFKGAEPLLRGRVLLTGFHGDNVWSKNPGDLSENIVRGDQSGLSLAEYRLQVGFIHCPLPFWGVRQIRDINLISNSPEMKPWDVPGEYSRPICRRIVEEAGGAREMFGIRKMAPSVIFNISDRFLSQQSTEDYLSWLKRNRKEWIRRKRIPPLLSPHIDHWERKARAYLISRCQNNRLIWRISSSLDDMPTPMRRYLFPWAIEHICQGSQHREHFLNSFS